MIDEAIYRLLKNSDDYIKIFIIIWIKIREIYLDDSKNNKVTLHKRMQSLSNFCNVIRRRCEKTGKLTKLTKLLRYIENECKNNKEKIDKLHNITALLKMFDLPKPVSDLIDNLGLSNPVENDFADVINGLFEEDININDVIEETKVEEIKEENIPNKPDEKLEVSELQNKNIIIIPKIINQQIETTKTLENTIKNEIYQQPRKPDINNFYNYRNTPRKYTNDLSAFGIT